MDPLAERKPRRDPASKPYNKPRWKLGALVLEEPLQVLVQFKKTRPPIAPSTLWKRRTLYVRGARPLHCNIIRRGKRARAQAEKN